jgi:hypothetical protein
MQDRLTPGFEATNRKDIMKRADANFTCQMSVMTDQERAEFIENGLSVLAALGL